MMDQLRQNCAMMNYCIDELYPIIPRGKLTLIVNDKCASHVHMGEIGK